MDSLISPGLVFSRVAHFAAFPLLFNFLSGKMD